MFKRIEMENNQDNSWLKIKSLVEDYEPDEYTPADWGEMETILEAGLKPPGFFNGKSLPKLLLLVILGTSLALVSREYLGVKQRQTAVETSAAIDFENASQTTLKTSKVEIDGQKQVQAQEGVFSEADKKTPSYTDTATEPVATDRTEDLILQKEKSLSAKESSTDLIDAATGKTLESANTPPVLTSQESGITQEPKEEEGISNNSSVSPIPTLRIIPASETEKDKEDMSFSDPNTPSKWRLGVTLGMSSTVTDYERKTMSSLPFIGIFARKTINPKWELQVEAQLKPVTNYDVTQRYEEDVYSSLGFLGTAVVERSYQGYIALELPVMVKYAVTNRTGLSFGARYSFITPHDIAYSSSGYDRYSESLSLRVPEKGFWNSDIGFIVGAEHAFGSRWFLSIRYAQGLRDITPDNLYNDTKTHLNSDVQLAVQHYF
jgi:hypothetical protein